MMEIGILLPSPTLPMFSERQLIHYKRLRAWGREPGAQGKNVPCIMELTQMHNKMTGFSASANTFRNINFK